MKVADSDAKGFKSKETSNVAVELVDNNVVVKVKEFKSIK
jgi:hypothetical protein